MESYEELYNSGQFSNDYSQGRSRANADADYESEREWEQKDSASAHSAAASGAAAANPTTSAAEALLRAHLAAGAVVAPVAAGARLSSALAPSSFVTAVLRARGEGSGALLASVAGADLLTAQQGVLVGSSATANVVKPAPGPRSTYADRVRTRPASNSAAAGGGYADAAAAAATVAAASTYAGRYEKNRRVQAQTRTELLKEVSGVPSHSRSRSSGDKTEHEGGLYCGGTDEQGRALADLMFTQCASQWHHGLRSDTKPRPL